MAPETNGFGETNNGGINSTLPVYKEISANSSPVEVCYDNNTGNLNKLGNRDFILFEVQSAGIYQVLLPKGILSATTDADLSIHKLGTSIGNDYSVQNNGAAYLNIYLTLQIAYY